ncbi:FAD-binding protein [Amycolatopsis sp. RM579]|uniref:FAD-binding protein n=2 Tax=Amycolatopsis pithecellobii TaxID=664692 RepID=A0A6N7YUT7_9PSEU|nr:FAD-binding protein [Amycolatopsis pithecellobii]
MPEVVLERGAAAYEQARRDAVWNGRTPHRYPDVIVQAQTSEDVITAVGLAARKDLRIGVRSGGHSWAGNHLRDGGMLLDVSRLDQLEVDPDAMTAVVGPGFKGIAGALQPYGLFFPGGHDLDVGVGGYLLQGGFGWNGRVHGPACMSVEAIDVVTGDGELVHADEHHHSDLLWAARGSGPGFFGVVVAFHLRLYQAPKHIASSLLRFPFEIAEDVFRWVQEVTPTLAREVELSLFVHRNENGEPEITLTAPALVDSATEAAEALAFVSECPLLANALEIVPNSEVSLSDLYAGVAGFYPTGARYAVDNMWTHARASELLPGIRKIAETLPPYPSAMMWNHWGGDASSRPPMAFSVEDETYLAVYGVWNDPADDERYATWPEERMREMAHLSTGIQLADENLGRRPARFVSDENLARLDEIRARYDPAGRFHSWMASTK